MEIFDIVDEKGIPTGETIERTQAHEKGVRHRTAHIWIVREQDGKAQLLLQKRSAEKDSFPGRFDTSSAGHIQAGDVLHGRFHNQGNFTPTGNPGSKGGSYIRRMF